MPIELTCPECRRLLRVADEHVGKQARCPNCSAVFTVNANSSPLDTDAAAGGSSSPFVPTNARAGVDESNPYAAPTSYIDPGTESFSDRSLRQIDFQDVFANTWEIFKERWLMSCVAVLIVMAINVGLSIVQNVVLEGLAAVVNDQVVAMAAKFVTMIAVGVIQIWLGIGQVMVFFDVARGNEINVGKLFGGGPYLMHTLLAVILVSLILGGILVVLCGIPAAVCYFVMQNVNAAAVATGVGVLIALVPVTFVWLMYSQIQLLIIDRGLNAFASLRASREITAGNKLNIFAIVLLLFVIGICAAVLGLLALCIGIIPASIGYTAFSALTFVVMYLSMTGQHISVPEL